ncbi:UPAR/Ly6 domain-containing protein crok-like [Tubulanus polymorphus]|uniref:UPAR/Ly6 domain-containing protein crok-like n=1 Tax=Tubulanus polymorphus TaxID=672921 RepID=UPI003DA6CBA1
MNKIFLVLAVGLVFAFSIEYTSSIKCYLCNTYAQPLKCNDWFDNSTQPVRDCPDNTTLGPAIGCRKIVQEAEFEGKWNVRIVRQCAYHGEPGADEGRVCKERVGTYRVRVRYCHCNNKDGCNTATGAKISYAALLPVLLITAAFGYKSLHWTLS